MAQSDRTTLFQIKVEALEQVLVQFPETHAKMMKEARVKRAKHKKLITKCQKKFPVYGMMALGADTGGTNQATIDKLKKFGLDVDSYTNHGISTKKGGNANTIGDILNFLEEVDQQFDKDKVTPDDLQKLKEALQNKTENINVELTKDGEFTRDVTILLHQRAKNGQVDDYEDLMHDLKNIKDLYQTNATSPVKTRQDAPPDATKLSDRSGIHGSNTNNSALGDHAGRRSKLNREDGGQGFTQ